MNNTYAQQPNQDQDEHDLWLAQQTDESMDKLVSGIASLAHSKGLTGQISSPGTPADSSKSNSAPSETPSTKSYDLDNLTGMDLEIARIVGFM